jgi:glycine cleavage system regulatory protein
MNDEQNHRRHIDWGTVASWLVGLAIIGGGVWGLIYSHRASVREQRTAETQQQQRDASHAASIAALALKYNAVTNWEASLPALGASEPFSIEVSNALIRSNGQPVLLELDLEDVAGKNSGYTAQFSQLYLTNQNFQLSVELQCTVEQTKQLLVIHKNNGIQCAVVARVTEVSRPKFKLAGSVSGSGEDAEFSVKLDDSEDVFLARGELLDIVRLP